jgi:hypothetical protein
VYVIETTIIGADWRKAKVIHDHILTIKARKSLRDRCMPYRPVGIVNVGNEAGLGRSLRGGCIKSDWRACLENGSAGQITIHDDSQLLGRMWNGRVGCRLSTVLVLCQTVIMCGVLL